MKQRQDISLQLCSASLQATPTEFWHRNKEWSVWMLVKLCSGGQFYLYLFDTFNTPWVSTGHNQLRCWFLFSSPWQQHSLRRLSVLLMVPSEPQESYDSRNLCGLVSWTACCWSWSLQLLCGRVCRQTGRSDTSKAWLAAHQEESALMKLDVTVISEPVLLMSDWW